GREETRGMQTTGRLENTLAAAKLVRERRQHHGFDARTIRERCVIMRERLDRCRAADAAGGAREEGALRPPTCAVPHVDVDLIRFDDVVDDGHAVLALARLRADAYAGHISQRAS